MNTQDITLMGRERDEALISLGRAHLENAKLLEANNLLRGQYEAALAKIAELVAQVEQIHYTPEFFISQLLNDLRAGNIPLPVPLDTVVGIPTISAGNEKIFMDRGKIILPIDFSWPHCDCTVDFALCIGLRHDSERYPSYRPISWENFAPQKKPRRHAPAKTVTAKKT